MICRLPVLALIRRDRERTKESEKESEKQLRRERTCADPRGFDDYPREKPSELVGLRSRFLLQDRWPVVSPRLHLGESDDVYPCDALSLDGCHLRNKFRARRGSEENFQGSFFVVRWRLEAF